MHVHNIQSTLIITHKSVEATDTASTYVRIAADLADYSKAFDLIDHNLLVNKLVDIGLTRHIVRWMAAFLADRSPRVKLRDVYSARVIQTEVSHKERLQDLKISWCSKRSEDAFPLCKYVDDGTLFEICTLNSTSELHVQGIGQHNIKMDQRNRMKINVTKTKEMVICFCKDTGHTVECSRGSHC